MITYQEIYDILRKEKYSESLQQLPKNFLEEVSAYIEEKKEIINREKNEGLFSGTVAMTRKQLDNTLAIIKEIISIRERKVLNLAFTAAMTGISKRDTDNLLEYEKKLFGVTVKQLEENQQQISQGLSGKINRGEKDLKNVLVRFKEEVPAFVAEDGSELGPFKPGDVANLPQEITEILLAEGKVALIEER
ncbi:MAG: hypothetical protein K6T16_03270 [Candidatus Pacearchaeota archaeon]|nr:hypothetical protein [Candidatus Pacearchaeota archaeon]